MKHKHKNNKHVTSQTKPEQQKDLTYLEHLCEIRNRLFWVILTLVITSAIGFQYKDQLINVVMAPLKGEKLVYLTPGGGFSFIFTVSIYFGLLLTIPVIVYHIFKFMQPLMHNNSRGFIAKIIGMSGILAVVGISFGYHVAVPAAINFLTTFAGDAVSPNLTADSYLSFVVTYVFGLAALFQIPLLLFLVDYIRPIPPGKLGHFQQYVILAAAIISAVITPTPDAVNMAIIAVPIIAVYELGVMAVYIRHRMTRSAIKKAARTFVMPETPDEVLAAVIERERPAISGGPTLPPEKEPALEITPQSLQTEQVVMPAPTAKQMQMSRPVRLMDGFGPAARVVSSQKVMSHPAPVASKPALTPTSATIQGKRSLDGFGPVRHSFQGTAPQIRKQATVRQMQPAQPARIARPAVARLRPIRSFDGFSMV